MSGDDLDSTINLPDSPAPSGDQTTKPLSRRGGPRPGSGRPKGAKDKRQRLSRQLKATFAERYRTKVEENAEQLIDAAITAGTRGDSRMLLDMVTRFVGPARTSVEISGPNGAPLQLQAMAATALVSLTDAQLDALAAFHQQLAPVASGDSASLLSLPLGNTPAPLPDLPDPHDSPGHPENPDASSAQTDTRSSLPETDREEVNGGSAGSQSTSQPRTPDSLDAARSTGEGGESGS